MHKASPMYEFSAEKNQQLIMESGISFEEAIAALNNNQLIDIIDHPNASKYPNQLIYILEINGYVYLLPFVRKNESTVFLKTLFPSRKLTKKYLINGEAS
ncbi:MAG TPA: toxin [Gammaproteobacteria bacterium]|nr:toxin [Gammaproteobacteria bacterium]